MDGRERRIREPHDQQVTLRTSLAVTPVDSAAFTEPVDARIEVAPDIGWIDTSGLVVKPGDFRAPQLSGVFTKRLRQGAVLADERHSPEEQKGE